MVGHRKAIETLYDCTCDVFEYKQEKGADNITMGREEKVYSGLPCRLSHYALYTTTQSRVVDYTKMSVKLFLSPEVKIGAGSKISVYKNGMCIDFKNSGEPAIYTDHQEIRLSVLKNWG